MRLSFQILFVLCLSIFSARLSAQETAADSLLPKKIDVVELTESMATDAPDSTILAVDSMSQLVVADQYKFGYQEHGDKLTLYDLPYSQSRSMPDWKRLWVNTGILMGAGVTTMLILESLPADATAWNKTENGKVSMFKRWWRNVHLGPVWDKDNLVFNFVLHPYAGAAYYMGARSNGFNMWGSFLYTFCISSFFWEYGFEAFNEIPSIQDLLITPVVGTILGEGFYVAKRYIVNNGYRLWGSKVLGYAVAFLLDPINELTGYFRGYQKKLTYRAEKRKGHDESGGLDMSTWIAPDRNGLQGGISITYTF